MYIWTVSQINKTKEWIEINKYSLGLFFVFAGGAQHL